MSSNSHMCAASTLSQAFFPAVCTSEGENTKPGKDGKVPVVLWHALGGRVACFSFLRSRKSTSES